VAIKDAIMEFNKEVGKGKIKGDVLF